TGATTSPMAMNTAAGVRAIVWDPDEAATAVTTAAVTAMRTVAVTAIRTAAVTVIRAVAATATRAAVVTAIRTAAVTGSRAAARRITIGPRLRRGRPRRFRIAREVAEGGPFRVLV
ncbi:MAG TPA: hypothetical protein VNZ53_44605, partial [Steroidobacteraceae bacterium]|nr:hypothetical protein [Steroidobacteraceae bacterium]